MEPGLPAAILPTAGAENSGSPGQPGNPPWRVPLHRVPATPFVPGISIPDAEFIWQRATASRRLLVPGIGMADAVSLWQRLTPTGRVLLGLPHELPSMLGLCQGFQWHPGTPPMPGGGRREVCQRAKGAETKHWPPGVPGAPEEELPSGNRWEPYSASRAQGIGMSGRPQSLPPSP